MTIYGEIVMNYSVRPKTVKQLFACVICYCNH